MIGWRRKHEREHELAVETALLRNRPSRLDVRFAETREFLAAVDDESQIVRVGKQVLLE